LSSPPPSLQGRRVLITGAARGIGAETALALSRLGARVALVGLEPDELAATAARCGADTPWAVADVTDWAALEAAVAEVAQRLGGIDAVVANAGIGGGGPIRSVDPEAFERVIEVNLLGVWRTVRVCLPHVIASRGYVLVISSLAAATRAPLMGAYCASKAGVEAFADVLRLEVAHLGVDVGVAYFAFLDTDMVRGAEAESPVAALLRSRIPRFIGQSHPVSAGVGAVTAGLARRSRRIVAPRWVRAILFVRGIVNDIGERRVTEIMPRVEEMVATQMAEQGAQASVPVGPGGRAAWEARRQPSAQETAPTVGGGIVERRDGVRSEAGQTGR